MLRRDGLHWRDALQEYWLIGFREEGRKMRGRLFNGRYDELDLMALIL